MTTVQARGYAKVNLHLGVGALREDGYHELSTIFQALDLYDEITLTTCVGDGVLSLDCSGAPGVPTDATNLLWQAVEKLYALHQGEPFGVQITLKKGIPTAGGMAGGSADAAAGLRAMNKLISPAVSEETLLALAAELGSDVPFTLVGGTQQATGRGEILTPVLSRGSYYWALAFSHEGLSTPTVFKKLDTLERTPVLAVEELKAALRSGDPHELAAYLHNDMQAAAISLQPRLRRVLAAGKNAGALAAIVSGSGPTCAFLCEDAHIAEEVAAELRLLGKAITACSPAPGARVEEVIE
ncbi:4-diphosphocytidyl-2-C-methyl-D-erythritol kinase [Corynebacterium kutscheri]|uniref:4-diphosphocytidyl-2-C-methyl-D-erythritol kinase n=1 Tax=Corynebacterium kutscheri TaxID=35755 RepID=A0A0F6TDQ0_9CORY|nr:4-(cytidine 5'-diphospho)-2-C-methyl-D-erythritol kinase [Corynebacterium kutscheri]AKE41816.1 4-diphosphocytidyl-2-C-methyl-D-erythritol kinase [Corynebacterium kutscheri]VEH04278.1 4-diphosphocytidyl-2-C-methyl-D-erythritol kinase [Corynebacterium kutscheri]VEH10144.1 4-diphosphocytidyl-2-C-methyl-D-erythritol kinase [Corynebacterium kutscheri]VEH80226.1 4-diphosphocytidyl-2-C-methyl-D-erythritol kinase [Corynebacterium kutscheri]